MIEDNIKHPVVAQIPLDEIIALNSINRGVPFMADARTKPIAQAVQQLAERVAVDLQRSGSEFAGLKSEAEESARKKAGLFR
jgi:MinD-like ATPase involved in chromosome partitioning or flagellar assembly